MSAPVTEFVFLDQLPEDEQNIPKSQRYAMYRQFAAALKERPNTWGVFPAKTARASLTAAAIREGRTAAFAGRHYDAVVRNGQVYVMYDPEAI